ncbi:MAG: gliding motility lipoprotein GldH [Chryseolinea sp.]
MRVLLALCMMALLSACDGNRVYEDIKDFDERQWMATEKPSFEFIVDDVNARYNLYSDIRNSVSYPYSRFFYTYYLQDSSGTNLQKKLMTQYFFDAKTGEPFGKSGIGDLYDHRFLLLKGYQFKEKGTYRIVFEQFMRMETLPGMVAVGLRVEKTVAGETVNTY